MPFRHMDNPVLNQLEVPEQAPCQKKPVVPIVFEGTEGEG